MTGRLPLRRWAGGTGVFVALAVALNPVFFVIYRLMVFNTVPRDDYAPFLLWLVGAPGGNVMGSPYGYRLLSVVAAAPFYYLLPSVQVTNLATELTAPYLRATAAIAALSYVSLLLAAALVYRLARDRYALGWHEAALAAVLLLGLELNCRFFAIDPLAIMLIVAGLWLLPKRGAFALFIILSVFCNEKIAIVFGLWLTLRCVASTSDRGSIGAQWLATMVAIAIYIAALCILRLPGNSYQIQPANYFATLLGNLRALLSARGILLEIVPVLLVIVAAVLGWRYHHDNPRTALFRRLDVLLIPALILVAMVLTDGFDIGRIVTFAAPFYAVPAAAAMGRWLTPATTAA